MLLVSINIPLAGWYWNWLAASIANWKYWHQIRTQIQQTSRHCLDPFSENTNFLNATRFFSRTKLRLLISPSICKFINKQGPRFLFPAARISRADTTAIIHDDQRHEVMWHVAPVRQWNIFVSLGWLSHCFDWHYSRWINPGVWLASTIDREDSFICPGNTNLGLIRLFSAIFYPWQVYTSVEKGRFNQQTSTKKRRTVTNENHWQSCQLCYC